MVLILQKRVIHILVFKLQEFFGGGGHYIEVLIPVYI